MLMRKFLALALCAVMLAGCGPAESSSTVSVDTQIYTNLSIPSSVKITTMSFFDNYGDGITTVNERNEWTDAISERYQTDLSVVVPADNSIYQTTYATAANGELTGIMELNSFMELQTLVDLGRILPLDDYLEHNKAWKALPEQVRSLYQVDGKTYGVPAYFYYTMETRSYETELIEKAGGTVPTTPEEFKQFAQTLIENELIPEFQYVLGGGGNGLAWATDFLNAFGVYIARSGQYPFAYDPEADAIIDPFLTNNAQLALQYLRELFEMGALNWNFDVIDVDEYLDNIKNGMYGSFYAPSGQGKYDFGITTLANRIYNSTKEWPNADEDWEKLTAFITESYTMSGNGTDGVRLLYPSSTPYVLLAGTSQPAECINFFVDLLFASESNYLEAYVGLSENYVRNADGTISLKMILSEDGGLNYNDEVYTPRHRAGLVDKIEGLYSNAQVFIATSNDDAQIAREKEVFDYTNQQLSEAMLTRAATKMPGVYGSVQSKQLVQKYNDVYEAFHKCYSDAITNPDVTVEQALATYRNEMRALGGDQILSEANTAIGKKVTQQY